MDAPCLRIGAVTFLLLAAGGCLNLNSGVRPAQNGGQPPAPPPQPEPPQVVETPDEPPTKTVEDPVTSSVLQYLERVDDAQQPSEPRDRSVAVQVYPAQQVSDEQPAEQPATEPRVIRVIPEHATANDPAVAPVDPPRTRGQADIPAPAAPSSAEPSTDADTSTDPISPPDLKPPELDEVTIRAARDIEPTATYDPPQPGVNEAAVADLPGPASLRALLERAPLPEDASFREQLDRRLLWIVVGDYDRAREPLNFVTEHEQHVADRFIEAWIALRERDGGDFSTGATDAAVRIAELQQALRTAGDLMIPTVAVCSAVRGFGQYDVIQPVRFAAGAAVEFVLYVEVRNFVAHPQDDGRFESRFDMTTTVLDAAGQVVLELPDRDIVDRCLARRTDCFIPRLVRLPASLSPGPYVAKVTIVDKLGEKVAEGRTAFEITGR